MSLLAPPQSPTHFPSRNSLALSDTATFHSAHVELDGSSLLKNIESGHNTSVPNNYMDLISPESHAMERSDSGYAQNTDNERRSTSSSSSCTNRHRNQKKPSSSTPRTSSSSTRHERPVPKRASRSTPTASSNTRTSRRPSMQSRYTTDATHSSIRPHHQFFHFPSLAPTPADTDSHYQLQECPAPAPVHVPLAKPIYWTSPSTRRLEYAAIDACSHGVKGFLVKLVPDCVLPREFRSTWRSRFHDPEGEENSDAGSVRRYRIDVEDDDEVEKSGKSGGRALVRRFTGMGKK